MKQAARDELSAFLRTRRERISPESVGLPVGGRRRTPGLRREEVAQLAGVGVTWYTWLEQGREIQCSQQVLEAIARALHLDPDERFHFMTLAGGDARGTAVSDTVVTDEHLMIMEQMLPNPCCIQSAKLDVLACNRTYRFMIGDILDNPPSDRNCMIKMFVDPEWRNSYTNFESVARQTVARFRAAMIDHFDDPSWVNTVSRLRSTSQEFDSLWSQGVLQSDGIQEERFDLPRVGITNLRFTRLSLDNPSTARLAILTPIADSDAAAIRRLDEMVRDLAPASQKAPTVSPQQEKMSA